MAQAIAITVPRKQKDSSNLQRVDKSKQIEMLPQEQTTRQTLLREITLHRPAADIIMSDKIET